jgi:hypothetical protein
MASRTSWSNGLSSAPASTVWHDVRPLSSEPPDIQLIAALPEAERRVLDAWVEQLEAVKVVRSVGACR